jgi:hypothetical protein
MAGLRVAAALALAALGASSALANDSSAALGAGGLTLVESADVRMASEDLFISRQAVRVRYEFVNDSAKAITTTVAFPLPVVDMDIVSDSDVNWPTQDEANPIAFKVRVGGRAVKPSLEQRAFLKDVEVSDVLRRHKLPFGHDAYLVGEAIKKLPAAAKDELKRKGIADIGGDYARPLWTLKNTFHWPQTFPARRTLVVEHEYKPIVGGGMLPAFAHAENPKLLQTDAYFKGACVDDQTMGAIDARLRTLQRQRGDSAMLLMSFVEYVLTTGKNWKGPIGKFRLTVDKGKADNLISFCMDGVKKISATTFRVDKTDFEPEQDLRIMVLATPPAS